MTGLDGVVAVTALVDHRPGAVVSRTLVKNSGGSVTAFTFDAGEGLSEHTAHFDALVLVVEGDAAISIGGTRHVVTAGHMIRLPADVPHAVEAMTRVTMLLIMIRP